MIAKHYTLRKEESADNSNDRNRNKNTQELRRDWAGLLGFEKVTANTSFIGVALGMACLPAQPRAAAAAWFACSRPPW